MIEIMRLATCCQRLASITFKDYLLSIWKDASCKENIASSQQPVASSQLQFFKH